MEEITISGLFAQAAKRMRAEFEEIRASNPHPGGKGVEAEEVLRRFLNTHLPRRYNACSGVMIDNENHLSRQTDVLIYDALSSPVYRASEQVQIVPADAVASVIEVKSALNKAELKDGFEKIASCKRLVKRPYSSTDQSPTGSGLISTATFGVIFGFDSDSSLESLAENVKEFNSQYDSTLWPDMIVVLDKGTISRAFSFPGAGGDFAVDLAPQDEDFQPPPFYIHVVFRQDGVLSLNRFVTHLLTHLSFYPRRISTAPFSVMLAGAATQGVRVANYQFDTKRKLRPVPPALYDGAPLRGERAMRIYDASGQEIGRMELIPWQDGYVISWKGVHRLNVFVPTLIPAYAHVVPFGGFEVSTVLSITKADFEQWPARLKENTNMKGALE